MNGLLYPEGITVPPHKKVQGLPTKYFCAHLYFLTNHSTHSSKSTRVLNPFHPATLTHFERLALHSTLAKQLRRAFNLVWGLRLRVYLFFKFR